MEPSRCYSEIELELRPFFFPTGKVSVREAHTVIPWTLLRTVMDKEVSVLTLAVAWISAAGCSANRDCKIDCHSDSETGQFET